jgi:hypothetical protein
MKTTTAEIMQGIKKDDALKYMERYNALQNSPHRFHRSLADWKHDVALSLEFIGIHVEGITGGTANAVHVRMEKKAGVYA